MCPQASEPWGPKRSQNAVLSSIFVFYDDSLSSISCCLDDFFTIFAPQICRPKNCPNAILSTIFVLFEASEYTFFNMNLGVRHCDFEGFASTKRRFLSLGGPAPGTLLRRPSRRPSGRKTAKMQYCRRFSCFTKIHCRQFRAAWMIS